MDAAATPTAEASPVQDVAACGGVVPPSSGSDSFLQMLDSASLRTIYLLAVKFFKENDGTLCHPSYDQRILLAALSKQVSCGSWSPSKNGVNSVGFFDRIGNDRKLAWRRLGDIDRDNAMIEFLKVLKDICPEIQLHLSAWKDGCAATKQPQGDVESDREMPFTIEK